MAATKTAKEIALKKLGNGCFSLTFLWRLRKKEYVLKCPAQKGHFVYKKWFFHVQRENLFLKEYAPKQQEIVLPKMVEMFDHYVVQKKIEGIPLTAQVYAHLPLLEQQKVTQQLAHFFFKLHKKTIQHISDKPKNRVILGKCLNFLDEEEKCFYQEARALLRKNPLTCTFSCLCITDLKANHILYNPKTKKVGMVDFGSIHFDFPESEFIVKNPIRSQLSLQMMKNVIEAYNMLQKKEIVSLKRIKGYLSLYALNEIYSGYVNKILLPSEKKRLKKISLDFFQKLKQL